VTLFGSPAYVYTDVVKTAYYWGRAWCRRGDARFYRHQFDHQFSYLTTRYRLFTAEGGRSVPSELVRFARAYIRKKQ
jgi:hypothetical protein